MSETKLTIIQAAQRAIKELGQPSTSTEIYDHIIKKNLYQFNAKDPQAILKSSLRRHSNENNISPKKSKILKKVGENKFDLL